jgi:hypothetical protein
LRASRTRLASRAAKQHKNRGDRLSPTEHWGLWTAFRGGTGPSLPVNSAIGSFSFHPWACDLFTTLSGQAAAVFRSLPSIQDATLNPYLTESDLVLGYPSQLEVVARFQCSPLPSLCSELSISASKANGTTGTTQQPRRNSSNRMGKRRHTAPHRSSPMLSHPVGQARLPSPPVP